MTTFLNNDDEPDDVSRDRRDRFETPREQPKRVNHSNLYSRRGKTPTVFNGMHRRRNKRVHW